MLIREGKRCRDKGGTARKRYRSLGVLSWFCLKGYTQKYLGVLYRTKTPNRWKVLAFFILEKTTKGVQALHITSSWSAEPSLMLGSSPPNPPRFAHIVLRGRSLLCPPPWQSNNAILFYFTQNSELQFSTSEQKLSFQHQFGKKLRGYLHLYQPNACWLGTLRCCCVAGNR